MPLTPNSNFISRLDFQFRLQLRLLLITSDTTTPILNSRLQSPEQDRKNTLNFIVSFEGTCILKWKSIQLNVSSNLKDD